MLITMSTRRAAFVGQQTRSTSVDSNGGARLAPPRYGIAAADGTGQRLPTSLRGKMERAFGADFSAVRIHHDGAAASIHARAFTRGRDIHFAPGHYDPHSDAGQALLGHELAHVVQQTRGEVATLRRPGTFAINTDPRLEQRADDQGARAARGERVGGLGSGSGSARATASPGGVVQAAFIAKRAVGSFASLGLPAMGVFHHLHIFFEDGRDPPNWGFMGADIGLGEDVHDDRYNSKGGETIRTDLDDARMRRAVDAVDATGNFTKDKYRLAGNNCQHYVNAVLAKYAELDPNRKPIELAKPPPKDKGNEGKGSNDDPRACKVSDCAVM